MKHFILAAAALLTGAAGASAQPCHHHHRHMARIAAPAYAAQPSFAYEGARPYPDYGPVYRQACYGSEYNYGPHECGSASGGPSGAPNQGG